jgi:hypothetical protein
MDVLTDERPVERPDERPHERPVATDAAVELRAVLTRLAGEDRSGWSGPARVDRAVELVWLRDRLDAEVVRAVGDADRDAAWQGAGAVSAVSWLAHAAPVGRPAAARLVRAARLARDHEATGTALAEGDVSVAHVDELARVVRDREEVFVEHERALLDSARALAPKAFAVVARRWAELADDRLATRDAYEKFSRRHLHVSTTFGGMVAIDGLLDPEGGARVLAKLRSMDRSDRHGGRLPARSVGQRLADALVELCDGTAAAGRPPPAIDVLTDVEILLAVQPADVTAARCDLGEVGPVAPETLRRLACDAVLTRMVLSPSRVLDVGRPTKMIPEHLRRAVMARDGGCVFPGCDRPPGWCDLHHVVPRHQGGSTAEDNLVPLCRRHHVECHEGGWRIVRRPDGWTAERAPP